MSSLGAALGIQRRPGEDRWYRRAACAGQSWERFFVEHGGRRGAGATTFEDRARRICSRCEVRRPCTREAIQAETPQKVIVRNVAPGRGPEHVSERVLPVGVYGGSNAQQRWTADVIHLDDCGDSKCAGCRPLEDRLDLLEARFIADSPRWLTASERVV